MKVQYLVKGVCTSALDTCKTRILLDDQLKSDFDCCVNLYKDFIKASKDSSTDTGGGGARTVAEVNVKTNGGGNGGGRKSVIHANKIKDHYYRCKNYLTLSPKAKKKIKDMRSARGSRDNGGKLRKNIALAAMFTLKTEDGKADDKEMTNRNNRKLTQQQQSQN